MNSTFIDIGGNVGLYSLYFKKKFNSKIFIFEPDANNLELLHTTNKIKNFLLDEYTGATGSLEVTNNVPQQRS